MWFYILCWVPRCRTLEASYREAFMQRLACSPSDRQPINLHMQHGQSQPGWRRAILEYQAISVPRFRCRGLGSQGGGEQSWNTTLSRYPGPGAKLRYTGWRRAVLEYQVISILALMYRDLGTQARDEQSWKIKLSTHLGSGAEAHVPRLATITLRIRSYVSTCAQVPRLKYPGWRRAILGQMLSMCLVSSTDA